MQRIGTGIAVDKMLALTAQLPCVQIANVADNLKKRGWSLRYVSAADCQGRRILILDAHRADEECFIVRADEKLTAFVELIPVSGKTLHRN